MAPARLGLFTALLWLWFLTLAIALFRVIALDATRQATTGRILLSTVGTQWVVTTITRVE